MRARRNETAAVVLGYLAGHGGKTALAVAKACDLGGANAATTLGRLYRQGLIEREWAELEGEEVVVDEEEGVTRPKWAFRYAITARGRDRLKWLRDNAGA